MNILDLLDIEIDSYMVEHQELPVGIRLSYSMLRVLETDANCQRRYLGFIQAVGDDWLGWRGIPLAIDRMTDNRFLISLICNEAKLIELKFSETT